MKKEFDFKLTLLKYFWDNREKSILKSPTGVMKQKYLFFYNMFAKVNNQPYTLSGLKAFKNGPVFQDIYKAAQKNPRLESSNFAVQKINDDLAKITVFLLELYGSRISAASHKFDLWQNAYSRANKTIEDEDITEDDIFKIKCLFEETKYALENCSLYFNKHRVPLLLPKEKKNYIINNFEDELNSLELEEIIPVYVTEENGVINFG